MREAADRIRAGGTTNTTTVMIYARLYYVHPRMHKAKKASVEAHPERLKAELEQWQRELTTNADTDSTTVAVSLDGNYVTHIGPMDNHRKAALRRAGVSFPGAPSTDSMRDPAPPTATQNLREL